MNGRMMSLALAVGLGACSGEEAPAPSEASEPGPAEAAATATEEAPTTTAAPPVTVASCTTPFGYCEEWAGEHWTQLGPDDAAREAQARRRCRAGFAIGAACTREGLVGSCVTRGRVTYFTGNPATARSSCRGSIGQWVEP